MEEDIKNYSRTVMFRGTPCSLTSLLLNQLLSEMGLLTLHNSYFKSKLESKTRV